jgi:hypothetical protein
MKGLSYASRFNRSSKRIRMLSMFTLIFAAATVVVIFGIVPSTSATGENAVRKVAVVTQSECIDLPEAAPSSCDTDAHDALTCNTNLRGDFEQVVFNPCTGESVLITGEMHVVNHSTTNNNSTHTRFHVQMHGTGTTVDDSAKLLGMKFLLASTNPLQGTRYTFNSILDGGSNSGPPPENFSDPFTVNVISHGKSPNFYMRFVLHTNVTPSGQTTCVVHSSDTCSGQEEIGR